MTYLKILNPNEKAEIEAKLKEQFAVNSIPGILIKRGEERIFFFSGDLSEEQVENLEKCAFIERMGVYFGKVINGEIRLSIEGSQILGKQIKKNIFTLNSEQTKEWMMGRELLISTGKKGFLIMKSDSDFLGTGKASEHKIGNFIPKSRRLKEKN